MAKDDVLYRELLDNLYDPVYFADKDFRITYWNRSAEELTGYSQEEVLGHHCSDNILVHVDEEGRQICNAGCPLKETVRDGKPREADFYLHHKKGHRIPVSVRITPIRDEQGEIVGAVEIFSDNSSRMELIRRIEELEKVSLLCPLTGIGNRRLTKMTLEKTFSEFHRFNWLFGIMFVDIDNFKSFNDKYGHATGDDVLQMVANTLQKSLRSYDFIGRWGGEEFIVIVPNVDEDGFHTIAHRSRMIVANSFLMKDGEELRVTVSIGGTFAKTDDAPETLVERADRLMYKSKAAGKDRVTIE